MLPDSFMRLKFTKCLVFACLITFSCNEEPENPSNNFDRKELLENTGKNIIIPAYENFSQRTGGLLQEAMAFVNSPTVNNLTTLQQAWEAAALQWQRAVMFNLGPAELENLNMKVSRWPTSPTSIEEAIEGATEINEAYIQSLSVNIKGLPALEYLLFDKQQGNAAVLSRFEGSENRKAFLVALCENLNSLAAAVYEAWQPDGGNYLTTFVNADGKDAGSSTTMLANQLIILTEIVKNEKVGIPLGKKSMGTILPNNVEAWRSGISLDLIKENIKAIEKVFAGDGENTAATGFDDYLNHVNVQYDGAPLSEVIKEQIDKIEVALDAIDAPLQDALETEREKVEAVYNETQRLVILLKTDMMSGLGLLITFSDNDGD